MSIFKKASITPIVRTVVSQGLESQDKPAIMTQTEAMEHFMPKIMSHGKDYAKFTEIKVRKAKPGEVVETFTADGKETQNTAEENDFVVTNLGGSGEEYILPADKLNKIDELLKTINNFEENIKDRQSKIEAIRAIQNNNINN